MSHVINVIVFIDATWHTRRVLMCGFNGAGTTSTNLFLNLNLFDLHHHNNDHGHRLHSGGTSRC